MASVSVRLTAPFALGDIVALVETATGEEVPLVLRGGVGRAELPASARRLRLSTDDPPAGEPPLREPSPDQAGEPRGDAVDAHALFDHGVPVPESGALELRLRWGMPCHTDAGEQPGEHKRFASWEHFLCARFVGRAAATDQAPPLDCGGVTAQFDAHTRLPAGNQQLQFGEIIALAGDFYAHLDERAAHDFAWAWPEVKGLTGWVTGDYRATTLADDSPDDARRVMQIVERDKDEERSAAHELVVAAEDAAKLDYPARRYLALASQNFCHFQCPRPGQNDDGNEALRLYRAYHQRALAAAEAARRAPNRERALLAALAVDAFGCHFLTDLFASGHIRVPRRLLGESYGVLRGALYMSHKMHAEDNRLGLWCTTRLKSEPRVVWRAYGDGELRSDKAEPHLMQVREAVRRSAAEVFARYCDVDVAPAARAEALVPVPLAPGESPRPRDVLPDGSRAFSGGEGGANHFPRYWFAADGRIASRRGEPHERSYRLGLSVVDFAELATRL